MKDSVAQHGTDFVRRCSTEVAIPNLIAFEDGEPAVLVTEQDAATRGIQVRLKETKVRARIPRKTKRLSNGFWASPCS